MLVLMFQSANTVAGQAGCLTTTGVMIVSHKDGQIVKASSKAGSTNGSVMLREEATILNSRGYTDDIVKVGFMRGPQAQLAKIVAVYAGKPMPGKLVVLEYLESDPVMREKLAEDLAYFEGDYERALGKKIKTNPKSGQVLTKGGQRIIRFVEYDMSGTVPDVFVQHDKVPQYQSVPTTPVPNVEPSLPVNEGDDDKLPF